MWAEREIYMRCAIQDRITELDRLEQQPKSSLKTLNDSQSWRDVLYFTKSLRLNAEKLESWSIHDLELLDDALGKMMRRLFSWKICKDTMSSWKQDYMRMRRMVISYFVQLNWTKNSTNQRSTYILWSEVMVLLRSRRISSLAASLMRKDINNVRLDKKPGSKSWFSTHNTISWWYCQQKLWRAM